MANDPLYGAKLKIKWAHHHIDEIHKAVTAYVQSKPTVFYKKLDTQSGEEVTYVRRPRPVPENIVVMTSYVVHDLRCALDHLAYALAVLNNAPAGRLKDVYFPVGDDKAGFESAGTQRKINMLSDEAQRFIAVYKPYKGGNEEFWLLNTLDVMDKHKTLIDVGLEGAISAFKEASVHPITVYISGWASLDEDVELWRHPAGTEQKPEAEMTLVVSLRDIAFGQQREAMAMTLHRIARVVEGIITQAEVKFFG